MSAESQSRPLLLGHRGSRLKKFPENSLTAFRHALQSGLDGFEFDLRRTADGHVICVHDAAIGEYAVTQCDYRQLCNQYMKTVQGAAAAIPSLQDVLSEFSSSAFLDIEIKVAGLEKLVWKLLKEHKAHRFVVSSFLAEVVLDLAETDPQIPLGFIFDDVIGLRTYPNLPVSYLMPRYDLLSRDLVEAFHRDGYKVFTWTVNRPRDMTRLVEWGVDGLISDNPVLLSETLRHR
ncbi:MAG TPA: glycerophosphodiester phosphodiesterase [Terriglobales bacterium]|nr:glycerophosphodiester phosphodiesterase [Terriglobales bacterium]